MMRLATTNLGRRMPAEDQILQITIAFAPFDTVLPAVAGLLRAEHGFSRAIDPAPERQWARLARLERERKKPTHIGDPLSSVHSVRVVEPKTTPAATIIEDAFAVDHDTPPTRLGDDMRRRAVQKGFGTGEDGLDFEGFIADNRLDACARAYQREMLEPIRIARSAKTLLDLMVRRDPAPDRSGKTPCAAPTCASRTHPN